MHPRTFFFFRGWDDNLFRVFFLLIFLSLFYLTFFILFIYFFSIHIYIYIFFFFFFFCVFYIYLCILLFHNFQTSVNSLQQSSFHNFKFALHFFFVLSAVSVDSSPLETVSVPSLSLTSLKFTNWLVLWDNYTQEGLGKTGVGGA